MFSRAMLRRILVNTLIVLSLTMGQFYCISYPIPAISVAAGIIILFYYVLYFVRRPGEHNLTFWQAGVLEQLRAI